MKGWKRWMALFLAAAISFQYTPFLEVHAEETSNEETAVEEISLEDVSADGVQDLEPEVVADQDTAVFQEAEKDVVESEKKVNYVTIASSSLYTPDTQSVVLGVGDEGDEIVGAKLVIRNQATHEEQTIPMDWHENNLAVFYIDYIDDSESGIYELVRAAYEIAGETYEVCFDEIGMDIAYGVNVETTTDPDVVLDEPLSEDESDCVVVYDDDGNPISEGGVAEALDAAKAQAATAYADNGANGNVIVVLDPGHDSTHAGARANNIQEEAAVFRIASYCKAELEKYHGITVYMTRDSYACPHPGTTSGDCNNARVNYAASVGANFYISFHLNFAASTAAQGVEVYYPNSSYNYSVHLAGYDMATRVLNNLVALGLVNRGTKIRDSESGDKYADGSISDYLGVIRGCKKYGIPAVLIEHAFVSNISDAMNYLGNEAQLQRLAVADAQAIASYFGLTQDTEYTSEDATIKASLNSTQTQYTISVAGIPECHAVKIAVWSEANGSDDLIWYNASKNSAGKWVVKGKVSKHKTAGNYLAHAYITRSNGSSYFIAGTTFAVSTPTAKKLSLTKSDDAKGTFTLKATGVSSAAGITKAQVAVWGNSDQSDLYWYTASAKEDGSYQVSGNLNKHKNHYGKYNAHLYLTDKNGIVAYAAGTTFTMDAPKQSVEAAVTEDESLVYFKVYTSASYAGSTIQDVRCAVWSDAGGQDDLVWYQGYKESDAVWRSVAETKRHKTAGRYQVHAYGTLANGQSVFLSSTTFTVNGPSAKDLSLTAKDEVEGSFTLTLGTISKDVSSVRVAVWSDSNQGNLYWYTAKKQNGKFVVQGKLSNHGYKYGTYIAHAYVTGTTGISAYGTSATFTLNAPKQSTEAAVTADESLAYFKVHTSASYAGSAIRDIRCAVWSEVNGQDDLIWYQAYKESNAVWRSVAETKRHKTAGRYQVHTYGTLANGQSVFLSSTTFSVNGPSAKDLSLTSKDEAEGNFMLTLGKASKDVSSVRVAVWSDGNQGNLYWYTAKKQNGKFVVQGKLSNHGYKYGTYIAHAYVTGTTGITVYGAATTFKLSAPKQSTEVAVTDDEVQAYIKVNTSAVYAGSAIRDIRCAVWSEANGQDDLVWYQAYKESNAVWRSVLAIKTHKTAGRYQVHTYGTLANGQTVMLSSTTFTVRGPRASKVESVNVEESMGTFQVKVSGVAAASGISKVQAAVWSQGNKSDMVWYNATKSANGTYVVYVDVRNHNNNLGKYEVSVYVADKNDVTVMAGTTECSMLNVSNAYYNIVGSTAITVQQMVSYYRENAVYPIFYMTSDAPTIEAFCQIYYEECTAEGIKTEVAFAQAMKETGFLRFGGVVRIEQFNFAGIGAVDSGATAPASFRNVREGIRAQVQHLKAYASNEALNNVCVDPRFSLVTRGCAPYVEWLGINENPQHKGWATAVNYGYSIKNDYIAKLLKK